MRTSFLLIFSIMLNNSFCNTSSTKISHKHNFYDSQENFVRDIQPPKGYKTEQINDFAIYLNGIPLKTDKKVYLYNGSLKSNQNAQYAVLDISVGHKDLQQCADAIMRLRAEFLYEQKDYNAIEFYTVNGTKLNYTDWLNGTRYKTYGNTLKPYKIPAHQRR